MLDNTSKLITSIKDPSLFYKITNNEVFNEKRDLYKKSSTHRKHYKCV